jgi:hypothetical protein
MLPETAAAPDPGKPGKLAVESAHTSKGAK